MYMYTHMYINIRFFSRLYDVLKIGDVPQRLS